MVINEIKCYSVSLSIISDGKYSKEFEKLNYDLGFHNRSSDEKPHKIYINSSRNLFSEGLEVSNEKANKLHGNEWRILKNEDGIYIDLVTFDLKKIRRFIVAYVLQFLDFKHYHCFHGAAIKINNRIVILLGNSGAGKSTLSGYALNQDCKVYTENFSLLFDTRLYPFYDHKAFSLDDFDKTEIPPIFIILEPGTEELEICKVSSEKLKEYSVTDYFFNIFYNHSEGKSKQLASQIDGAISSFKDMDVFQVGYKKDHNTVGEVFDSISTVSQTH